MLHIVTAAIPSSIEPLTIPIFRPVPCAACPISPAICVCPNFKIVGVGGFPELLDTAREDAGRSTRPTSCPVTSPRGVRQNPLPPIAFIQGHAILAFCAVRRIGLQLIFNRIMGIQLQRSRTIARNRAWINVLNCQCRGCTCPSRRSRSKRFCHPGLLPRTGLRI